MHFSIMCSELQRVLAKARPVIKSHSPIFILENFLFEITENQAVITSSDLEIVLRQKIGVPESGQTKFLVAAGLLSELIAQLRGNQDILFSLKENHKLEIIAKEGKYILSILDAKEYPEQPAFKPENNIAVDGNKLKEALQFVDYACAKDDLRPALTGILFECEDDNVVNFIATDGRRLARTTTNTQHAKQATSFVIPKKASDILVGILPDEETTINFNDAYLGIEFGNTTFLARLIKGKFPDYRAILPTENELTFTLDRKELLDAIKNLKKLTVSTKMVFNFKQQTLTLSVLTDEEDTQETQLTCTGKDEIEIAFNPGYLIEILSSIKEQEVKFELNSPTKAVIINSNSYTLNLVMPVKIENRQ